MGSAWGQRSCASTTQELSSSAAAATWLGTFTRVRESETEVKVQLLSLTQPISGHHNKFCGTVLLLEAFKLTDQTKPYLSPGLRVMLPPDCRGETPGTAGGHGRRDESQHGWACSGLSWALCGLGLIALGSPGLRVGLLGQPLQPGPAHADLSWAPW